MLNKTIIMGRLTADPRFTQTSSGVNVATFTLAVDRDRTEGVDFFPVVAWRGTAEFADKYLHKGKLVCVEGRLALRKWNDKNGNERRETEIHAEQIYFTGDRRE